MEIFPTTHININGRLSINSNRYIYQIDCKFELNLKIIVLYVVFEKCAEYSDQIFSFTLCKQSNSI